MLSTIDSSTTTPARGSLRPTLSPPNIVQSIPRYTDSDLPPQFKAHSLEEFQKSEGRENRKRRLRALWNRLPPLPQPKEHSSTDRTPKPLGPGGLTFEKAKSIRAMYDGELLVQCKGSKDRIKTQRVEWDEFKEYAKAKEVGKSIRSFRLTTNEY